MRWLCRHKLLFLVAAAMLGTSLVSPDAGHAYPWNPQPLQPGFCVTLGGEPVDYSSPVVGDLDNDGRDEIVVAGRDGWIYAVKSTGTLLWQHNVVSELDAIAYTAARKIVISSTPAIGDLDGDGYNEVVAGLGTDTDTLGHNGGMIVLDHNGRLYPGWPQSTSDVYRNGYSDGIWSSPALGDLDGDGKLEIVAGSFDQRVYVWRYDGTLMTGWPRYVEDTVWSSPAIADIDKDGYLDVIIGTDSWGTSGGYLQVFRRDGSQLPGFPQWVDEAMYSSPAVGDINGDGWLEIVSGSGSYPFGPRTKGIFAWDHTGSKLSGWPVLTEDYVVSSPTIGDLNGDGQAEIIAGTQAGTQGAKIYAVRGNGQALPGWPVRALDNFGNTGPLNYSSPVLANFDGDPAPEVMQTHYGDVIVLDQNGTYLTHNSADVRSGKPNMFMDYAQSATAAVADIDRDGRMEVIRAGGSHFPDGGRAFVCAWEMRVSPATTPWAMFRHDAQHTATYQPSQARDAVVVSHDIPRHMMAAASYAARITMKNTGTAPWTSGGGYRLAPLSGDPLAAAGAVGLASNETIAPGASKTFVIDLKAPGAQGLYNTQWRMIDGGSNAFGLVAAQHFKVGNEPALYVLLNKGGVQNSGVYAVGIAPPIPAPTNFSDWWGAKSLGISRQRPGGYFLLDTYGTMRYAGSTEHIGVAPAQPWDKTASYQQIIVSRNGTSYYLLHKSGVLYASTGADILMPAPPTFADNRMRSAALTSDEHGIYVIDGYGNIYMGGKAPALRTTPYAIPKLGSDIAKRIRLTADGQGYYVLDAYGRVFNGGTAAPIAAAYQAHMGENWARDFVLTEDGKGYYMLDKEGNIHTGGTAVAPTMNLIQGFGGQDVGLEIELVDGTSEPVDGTAVPALRVTAQQLSMLAQPGQPEVGQLRLTSLVGAITWTSSTDQSWLTVSPKSGTTPSDLMITATPQRLGMLTGHVQIATSANPGTPITVEVQVRAVTHVYQVYIPQVKR